MTARPWKSTVSESMKPVFRKPSKEVSERMKRVRSRGTGLENEMERILRNLRIRYHRQPDLWGNPDFRIRDTNVLIFCDSSFWHGRRGKEVSGKAFKRNRALWVEKLTKNRLRDERNNRALRRAGWSVWRFWDTDILKKPEKVKNRLRRIVHEAKA
jgi:DNA mismatch endonuclease (patch repair protein)